MTDPAIVEAAARALSIHLTGGERSWAFENERKRYLDIAGAVLAAVAPLIEAAALERAAKAFEPDEDGHDAHNYRWKVEEIAAAIRALKEQP